MESNFDLNTQSLIPTKKIIFNVHKSPMINDEDNIIIYGNTVYFRTIFGSLGGKFIPKLRAWKFKSQDCDKLSLFIHNLTDVFNDNLTKKIIKSENKIIYEINKDDDFAELFFRMEKNIKNSL